MIQWLIQSRTTKHVFHICHIAHIPFTDILLIELRTTCKGTVHMCYIGLIPSPVRHVTICSILLAAGGSPTHDLLANKKSLFERIIRW